MIVHGENWTTMVDLIAHLTGDGLDIDDERTVWLDSNDPECPEWTGQLLRYGRRLLWISYDGCEHLWRFSSVTEAAKAFRMVEDGTVCRDLERCFART